MGNHDTCDLVVDVDESNYLSLEDGVITYVSPMTYCVTRLATLRLKVHEV